MTSRHTISSIENLWNQVSLAGVVDCGDRKFELVGKLSKYPSNIMLRLEPNFEASRTLTATKSLKSVSS